MHGQNSFFGVQTNSGTLDAYDLSGKAIPTGNQAEVEGSSLLNDKFVKGVVKFKDGRKFSIDSLNFSLLNNELHFKKNNVELVFTNPVDEFVLPSTGNGKDRAVYFRSGYPDIDGNSSKTLYSLLSDGVNVQLLKYQYKSIQEIYHYSLGAEKKFVLKERMFVYDFNTRKISEVGRNINSLKKSLPSYAEDIDRFASSNKLNIHNEEDLVSLIQYLNRKPLIKQ